jgi:hypothetical protein
MLKFFGEFRLWLNKYASPTLLFKIQGLRQMLWVICADLNKIASSPVTEEFVAMHCSLAVASRSYLFTSTWTAASAGISSGIGIVSALYRFDPAYQLHVFQQNARVLHKKDQ